MNEQQGKGRRVTGRVWLLISLGGMLVLFLNACSNQELAAVLTSLVPPFETVLDEGGPVIIQADVAPFAAYDLPRWEPAECQFYLRLEEEVECGYLVVPEDRRYQRGQGKLETIRLHVAIVKSRSSTPAPDPLLYLSGGPGGETLIYINSIAPRFADILETRDLILFDQRGIGFSEPSLDCPEVMEEKLETIAQNLSRAEKIKGDYTTTATCRDRLAGAGVNLAAYTSAENAADINDLRLALDYEQINLYGVSYGSRLALTAMRDFGSTQTIRSVILDSVFPPQVDFYADLAVNAERIFDLLFDSCTLDIVCNDTYPELETVYYELVKKLEIEPVKIEVIGLRRSETYTMTLDGDGLIRLLFNMLYDTETIPEIPKLIYQLQQEDYSSRTLQIWLRWLIISNMFRSEGMWYSVMCAEEISFSTEDIVREAGTNVSPSIQGYFINLATASDFLVCETWGAREAVDVENEPVMSNIPTLILSGEFDPITPPAWNQMAAETLSQGYYFSFPGVGHGVFRARQCARDLAKTFLEKPAKEPNLICLSELAPFKFVTD